MSIKVQVQFKPFVIIKKKIGVPNIKKNVKTVNCYSDTKLNTAFFPVG